MQVKGYKIPGSPVYLLWAELCARAVRNIGGGPTSAWQLHVGTILITSPHLCCDASACPSRLWPTPVVVVPLPLGWQGGDVEHGRALPKATARPGRCLRLPAGLAASSPDPQSLPAVWLTSTSALFGHTIWLKWAAKVSRSRRRNPDGPRWVKTD